MPDLAPYVGDWSPAVFLLAAIAVILGSFAIACKEDKGG